MRLTIHDLERETGISRRTIHYYAHEGLIPSPTGSGPSASYGEEHLLRLRLIPSLKTAGLRLDRICQALDQLCVEEMRRLVAAAPEADLADPHRVATWLHRGRLPLDGATDVSPPRPEPAPDGCKRWLRHEVAPGFELHVCADTIGSADDLDVKLRRLDEMVRELFAEGAE